MSEFSSSSLNEGLYAETRSGRHVKIVESYGCPIDNCENVSFVECFLCEEIPNSFEEVRKSETKDEWLTAMTEEFNSLVQNNTLKLCELPAHKKSFGGRWVFPLKKDESGEIDFNEMSSNNFLLSLFFLLK